MPDKQAQEAAMREQAAIPSPGADLAANARYLEDATKRLGDPKLASMMRMRAITDQLGGSTPAQSMQPSAPQRAPTDAEVKQAYQKYMRDVVTAAHNHFHEHVQRVRSTANPTG